MTSPAAPVRSWFRCRNCGATIGEIVGVRMVVIVHGMTVTFPVVLDACFTCRKCGEPNTLGRMLDSRRESVASLPQDGRVQSA